MDESDRMPENRDLIVGVIQLGNLFARRLAPMFEKTNLTPQQWTILNVVADSGPMTLAALARKMIVSKQNMTGMVGRLRKAGYLERNDDPSDRRSAPVVVTRRRRAVGDERAKVVDGSQREAGTVTYDGKNTVVTDAAHIVRSIKATPTLEPAYGVLLIGRVRHRPARPRSRRSRRTATRQRIVIHHIAYQPRGMHLPRLHRSPRSIRIQVTAPHAQFTRPIGSSAPAAGGDASAPTASGHVGAAPVAVCAIAPAKSDLLTRIFACVSLRARPQTRMSLNHH